MQNKENKEFDLQAYLSKAAARLSVKQGRILIYRHLNKDGSELRHYTNGDIETVLDGKLQSTINIGQPITEAYIAHKYSKEVEYSKVDGSRRIPKPKKASSKPEEVAVEEPISEEELKQLEELLEQLDELVA